MEERSVIKRLYVAYDKVAKEALPPFWANNDAVALRSFKIQVIKDIPIEQRNEFELVCICTLDIVSCEVNLLEKGRYVVEADIDHFDDLEESKDV